MAWDRLSLNKLAEAIGNDAGLVDEEVVTAVCGGDESKALSSRAECQGVNNGGGQTFLLSNHLQVPVSAIVQMYAGRGRMSNVLPCAREGGQRCF